MLSYQHIYHAGNFADVQKHAVLMKLLRVLAQKPQNFAYLDTHAGRGTYDLSTDEAQKTGEFRHGILPFWKNRDAQAPLADYLETVASFNADGALKNYPGSAAIARAIMRPADRLLLVEKHPGEYAELQKNFAAAKNAETVQADGFQYLVDKVPFAERRGLVLVDPSYEIKSEYAELPKQLVRALKKWPQGQFMVWYPLLAAGGHENMLLALRKTDITNMLVSEIALTAPPQDTFGMYGSGVMIVNPPFGFEETLRALTQYIADRLAAKSTASVFWLDNRKISPETGRLSRI